MNTNASQIDQQAELVVGSLLGHAVGDALGVPVEFTSRETLHRNPVTDIRGFGTHNQPPGTWSDDTSLTLCTAEALCDGFDLKQMGDAFSRWLFRQHWTPRGEVFDVGQTTREAIFQLDRVEDPTLAGPASDICNGNGSLMRILPVALYLAMDAPESRRENVMKASCLTHGHPRSQLACAFYAELVSMLLNGVGFGEALEQTRGIYRPLIGNHYPSEADRFERILSPGLARTKAKEISGSGYVIHCLEASLWCCCQTGSYEEAVLAAVNLGSDTDTTGAVTGGLAALIYGKDAVPDRWISKLARHDEVLAMYERFAAACAEQWKERAT